MGEPIKVEAEVIEPVNLAKAPEPVITSTLPAVKVGNMKEIDGFVANVERFFSSVEIDPDDKKQVKELADVASDVKKAADGINSKRIAMGKEIKAATAESTDALNGLRDRLMAVYDDMRAKVGEAEERQRQARISLLEQEYEAVAPDLMELIPLDSFIKKESKLVSRDKRFTGNKACDLLDDLIADAVHDRARLREGDIEFSTEADMVYCKTLDLRKALDENDRLKREKAEREKHKQAATKLEAAVGRAHDAVSVPTSSEPVPTPEPAKKGPEKPSDPPKRYLFRLEFEADDADCAKVRDFMRTLPGLQGKLFKKVQEVAS